MSCDGNRGKFFAHVTRAGSSAATAFGGAAEAQAALEQIFTTARNQAPATPDMQQKMQAEMATRALFAQMTKAQLRPPTHSANGLPKADAQFGYLAVQQTLAALNKGQPLPALARQVKEAHSQKHQRTIDARGLNSVGRLHCTSCGQFTKAQGSHTCPMTTSPEAFGKTLQRRLGVPATAYPGDTLGKLISDAKHGPILMTHGLTGEPVDVTLDGLPLALASGFTPHAWQRQPGLAIVEVAGGRIVPVLNATGLQRVQLAQNSHAQAAQAFGVQVAPGTVMGVATSVPSLPTQQVAQRATTAVTGGQPYDVGHFIGTEYRKGGSHGQPVTVAGKTYTVGQRVSHQAAWGSARQSGIEPQPKGGNVGVGRTLYSAVGLLMEGEIAETADGQVQIFDKGRKNLLAVYDPQTNTAGDTPGSTNASSEQMAAVIAYRALHPQTPADAALANDLVRAMNGTGEPLAAADGAYIAIKNGPLAHGGTIAFGGQVGTQRCPQCGQFMGDAHNCPAGSAQANGAVPLTTAASDTVPTAADVTAAVPYGQPVVVQPHVDVNVDVPQLNVDAPQVTVEAKVAAPQVTVEARMAAPDVKATVEAPKVEVTVQLDAKELGEVLAANLKHIAPAAATQATGSANLTEMGAAMREMAAAMQALAATQQNIAAVAPASPQRQDAAKPKAAAQPEEAPGDRKRTTGRPIDITRPKTGQEHILDLVVLEAPDPYLTKVSAAVGGNLSRALTEDIPAPDPNFAVNEQTEKILRTMSSMLQMGGGNARNTWARAFGIYGPPGTGKNTTARQLAASIKTRDADGTITQGMNYAEVNITPESSMDEMIGTTILTTDPQTGATVSKVALGKIGMAAAMGSVICVNEIVRNPKLATALQSMLEDGEIHVNSPETGDLIKVPVHPSTVFVLTWNPGNEGDADRPAAAPLERIIPMHLGAPSAKEQEGRIDSFFAQFGTADTGGQDVVGDSEKRRQEILSRSYGIPSGQALVPTAAEKQAAVRFFNEINQMAQGFGGGRKLGLNSDTPTGPGPRRLNRFMAIGKTQGWASALETLKICCDQDDTFGDQWELVQETFARHFGDDGQTLSRPAPAMD
ncbi:MAG: MoxR family ATPase [Chloroflexota bacterium]|nr:MoxR family ATPase [Chloroflexota bacterium]